MVALPRVFPIGALVLLAVGFVARLAPLLGGGPRVLMQFPSEDAYLMLTISRNLALGLGMSVSDGTVPTNGTQPLVTFLWAALFWLVDGDREWGVRLAQFVELGISTLVPLLLYWLSLRVLVDRPYARSAGLLAGALWYSSTLFLFYSMNCQETGLYALAALAVALVWLQLEAAPSWRLSLGMGLGLGLCFWIRNDAVFLVAAVCTLHWLRGGAGERRERLIRSLAMGALAMAVALPWLIYNQVHFGSPVPISGQSQSLAVGIGEFAPRLLPTFAQLVMVVWPFKTILEGHPQILALGALICLPAFFLYARAWRRAGPEVRRLMLFVFVYGGLMAGYYGLFFGSPFFYKRYLFPLSPFFALGLAVGLCRLIHGEGSGLLSRRLGLCLLVFLVLFNTGLNIRSYVTGERHSHWTQVSYVREQVAPDAWVGAFQSGAVGFFHDRTLNLDGKTNPAALEARKRDRLAEYVLASPIEWVVDFTNVQAFADRPAIKRHFSLEERDPIRKLLVLRRVDP